jgi:DNA modification methylase
MRTTAAPAIEPIAKSVKALGHTPQYKMHKYFARRPYNVFSNLIAHYTAENDVVLDCFVGGGVTVFESLALKRKAVGVDLNPLATFITEMQIKKIDLKQLKAVAARFHEQLVQDIGHFYEVRINNEVHTIEWMEWAYVVECPHCQSPIRLTEDNKVKNGIYKCPKKTCASNTARTIGVKRIECKPVSTIPLRMKLKDASGTSMVRPLTEEERAYFSKIDYSRYLPDSYISIDEEIPQNWDRQLEDCLAQKGVFRFRDLFTERNFVANTIIFNRILEQKRSGIDKAYVDCLYFIFSASLRYTNKMTRVTDNWENGNPTSMDKHAYWLPNIFVETNVLDKFKNRIDAVIRGLTYTAKTIPHEIRAARDFEELLHQDKDYLILNQSSSRLPLPDKSVTAVITDPPYGSNVQYAELSAFWNVWYQKYRDLDTFIFNDEEAVVNRKQQLDNAKTVDHYEEVLYSIFKECYRVLKDEGYLVFTFNNKDINVWVALLKAVARAGFYLPENGVLFQDFIESYKNTSHLQYSGNIHGDFIYSFRKRPDNTTPAPMNRDYQEVLKETIADCIRDLYATSNAYTTTELYQSIFARLIPVIMDFALQNASDDDLLRFERLSNAFVDNTLKQLLHYDGSRWVKRKDFHHAADSNRAEQAPGIS